jgi:hypothetical protein
MLSYIKLHKILCFYRVYIINYKIIKVVQLDLSNVKILKRLFKKIPKFKLFCWLQVVTRDCLLVYPNLLSIFIRRIYFIIRCLKCTFYEVWYIYIITTLDYYTEFR